MEATRGIIQLVYGVVTSVFFAWGFVAYQGSEPLTMTHVFWFLVIVGTIGHAVSAVVNIVSYRFHRERSISQMVAALYKAQFPRSDYKNFKNGYGHFPSEASGAEGYIGEIAQWARWKDGATILATEDGSIPKWLIEALEWTVIKNQLSRLAGKAGMSAYAEDRFVEVSDLAVARYLKDDPEYRRSRVSLPEPDSTNQPV